MGEAMRCEIPVMAGSSSWASYIDCPRSAYGYYLDRHSDVVPHCAVHFGAALRREGKERERVRKQALDDEQREAVKRQIAALAEIGIPAGADYSYRQSRYTGRVIVDPKEVLAALKEARDATG